jgi:hypothetical protein
LKILSDLYNCILNTSLVTLDQNLRVLWRLIRGADARELGNLAFSRFLVQALGVAGLGHRKRDVDVDFNEREGCVFGVRPRKGVESASSFAVRLVG